MKHFLCTPKYLKFVVLSSLLAAILLFGTSLSQAQDQSQGVDKLPGIPQQLNSFDRSASVPDLIITDPDVNVLEEVEQLFGGGQISLIIPSAAFTADASFREWYFNFGTGAITPSISGFYCGVAPVYLPNGTQLNSFAAYLYDNDATYDASVVLYTKLLGDTTDAISTAAISTTLQSDQLQALLDTTLVAPTIVNNSLYSYHIGVCLMSGNQHRFYASQIFYTR